MLALSVYPSFAETNNSSFVVTPYLWVANIGLETSLPSQPSAGPEVDRFDTKISAGAMLSAQARYRSAGFFLDFAWLQLKTDATSPQPAYSTVKLQSDFIHSTAALTYCLPDAGNLHSELLAGARLWHVANDFTAAGGLLPGFNGNTDKTWVNPMIGASLSYDLGNGWSVVAKGLVGGFGVAADIAGEVLAGVNWQFAKHGSVMLGYRYLHEEYDRSSFTFNLDTQGFLVGVRFHF